MLSRYGIAGRSKKQACLGLPDVFALERGQSNHTPSQGGKHRKGKGFGVWFRSVGVL